MSSSPSLSADLNVVTSVPSHADFSFEALVAAYITCRRHKRGSASALTFERDRERNLFDLYSELKTGIWQPGPSNCFVITRPKFREVWAAPFRDRIVHHLLYNHLAPRFLAGFTADSCACIPGRGTLYGARRLEHQVRSATRNWKRPAWYLKLDIANFFVTIDKRVLWELLATRIQETCWRDLCRTVLFHDPRADAVFQSDQRQMAKVPRHKSLLNHPAHCGLPIGNLSSQFFANVYLDVIDKHVKHQLRAPHYVRYVDDMVLVYEDPAWLNAAKGSIKAALRDSLALELNPSKTILQPVDRGVDFVGQIVKPWRREMRRRTYREALARTASAANADVYNTANSYFGLFRQTTAGHHDRARLANVLRSRGHTVDRLLTKTFPTKGAT